MNHTYKKTNSVPLLTELWLTFMYILWNCDDLCIYNGDCMVWQKWNKMSVCQTRYPLHSQTKQLFSMVFSWFLEVLAYMNQVKCVCIMALHVWHLLLLLPENVWKNCRAVQWYQTSSGLLHVDSVDGDKTVHCAWIFNNIIIFIYCNWVVTRWQ